MPTKTKTEDDAMGIAMDRDWTVEERQVQLLALLVDATREIRDEMKSARKEAHRRANRGF